jgi:ubiquinone/menaquinone biosynthesis C-methylase UbiE
MDLRSHWEKIYRTKQHHEVSWWQDTPTTSLELVHALNLPKSSRIIDVGGGDSMLVDCLLAEGFNDMTVLDISEHALQRAHQRLGEKANRVKWIVGDVREFESPPHYDLWHDRATAHFLTDDRDIATYIAAASRAIKPRGYLVIGTFSTDGPTTCSGLPVRQYNEETMEQQLQQGFVKIRCRTEDHVTPFGTKQNFLFCCFQRKAV